MEKVLNKIKELSEKAWIRYAIPPLLVLNIAFAFSIFYESKSIPVEEIGNLISYQDRALTVLGIFITVYTLLFFEKGRFVQVLIYAQLKDKYVLSWFIGLLSIYISLYLIRTEEWLIIYHILLIVCILALGLNFIIIVQSLKEENILPSLDDLTKKGLVSKFEFVELLTDSLNIDSKLKYGKTFYLDIFKKLINDRQRASFNEPNTIVFETYIIAYLKYLSMIDEKVTAKDIVKNYIEAVYSSFLLKIEKLNINIESSDTSKSSFIVAYRFFCSLYKSNKDLQKLADDIYNEFGFFINNKLSIFNTDKFIQLVINEYFEEKLRFVSKRRFVNESSDNSLKIYNQYFWLEYFSCIYYMHMANKLALSITIKKWEEVNYWFKLLAPDESSKSIDLGNRICSPSIRYESNLGSLKLSIYCLYIVIQAFEKKDFSLIGISKISLKDLIALLYLIDELLIITQDEEKSTRKLTILNYGINYYREVNYKSKIVEIQTLEDSYYTINLYEIPKAISAMLILYDVKVGFLGERVFYKPLLTSMLEGMYTFSNKNLHTFPNIDFSLEPYNLREEIIVDEINQKNML